MATVTIRPDSTIDGGSPSWETDSGQPYHTALADDIDTYSQWMFGQAATVLRVGMGPISLPVGSVIDSVVPRSRWRGPGSEDCDASLYGRVNGTEVLWATINMTSSIVTYTHATQTTNPSGGAWTESDVNNLQVAGLRTAGPTHEQWFALYVDVNYTVHVAPTCTVSAPTGTITTTNQPTVTWSYSDADGDPQSQYQVKIFSAADYGSGGFNAETWPAVWDSTATTGTAGSRQVGVSLAAGITYKAYVKVADAISGFGAWAAGPTFSIVASGTDGPARLLFNVSSGTGSGAAGFYEFKDNKREGSFTWKSAAFRHPAGKQIAIREVQVYARTYDSNATIAVTVNGTTRTTTVASPSQQQLSFLFKERAETLDVTIVSTAGTVATNEAPSIEAVRIGTRGVHLLDP